MSITVEELEEKIKRVESDLLRMQASGEGIEKINIISDYLEFLKDELDRARDESQKT